MSVVTSRDGTEIVFDRIGDGPAVVIVGGIVGDRTQQAPVADLLAERYTVYNYDRRGHGESGFTAPYDPDREAEDLAAVIDQAGGSASVYATSGCVVIALRAAATGIRSPGSRSGSRPSSSTAAAHRSRPTIASSL